MKKGHDHEWHASDGDTFYARCGIENCRKPLRSGMWKYPPENARYMGYICSEHE